MTSARSLPLASLALLLVLPPTVALAAPPDLAEIRQAGSLRVLFPDQETSFFHRGEGEAAGFDLEVLRGFARLQGLELTPVVVPFSELIPALLDGRGDVIAGGYSVTPARSEHVRFTEQVTPQRHVVLTRAPRAAIDDPKLLAGLRVGVAPSSSWRLAALDAGVPEDRLVETLSVDPAAVSQAFVDDTIDAAVTGLMVAVVIAEADPDIHLGAFVGDPGGHAYAVRPDDAELLSALDDYLADTRAGSGWYRLVLEHFGPKAPDLFRRARG